MSLDKSIKYGKEKRKQYYKSGRFDRTCRPHGGCAYCDTNRLFKYCKDKLNADEQIQESEGS